MSKAKLKKVLSEMSQHEIAEMLCELYDARKEAKEYLDYWLNPDPRGYSESRKTIIERQFFTSAGTARNRPSLSKCSKAIKDFKSLSYDPELVTDIMLFYAETEARWLKTRYRRKTYRQSLDRNIRAARDEASKAGLEDIFRHRLEALDCQFRHLYDT